MGSALAVSTCRWRWLGSGGEPGSAPSGEDFDRAETAKKLRVPLLVLHGAEDLVCPPEDGQQISAAGGGEFVPVPGPWAITECGRAMGGTNAD